MLDPLMKMINDQLGYVRTSWQDNWVFNSKWQGRIFQPPTNSYQSLIIDEGIQPLQAALLRELGFLLLMT